MADKPKHPIYNDEEAARAHLERLRWPNGVVCVHCGATEEAISKVEKTATRRKPTPEGKRYKPARAGRYYCKQCEGTFTVTVGTVLEDSHVPLHVWFYAFREFQASKNGLSAHQLHRTIGVSYKTAWYMLHRIREAMRQGGLAPMGGAGRDGRKLGFNERRPVQFQLLDETTMQPVGDKREAVIAGPTLKPIRVTDSRFGDYCDPPMTHRGKPISYSDFVDGIASAALNYLKELVSEAEALVVPPPAP